VFVTDIRFGTDGWRAIIGEEFTFANVRRIADAAGRVFAEDAPAGTVLVGYDTRFRADAFAAEAAAAIAAHGLRVRLSDRMLPTPALSWATDRSDAIGAVMLTASHNPAEYLGFKLKMADGGSAPPSFTQRVEAALPSEAPERCSAEFQTVDLVTDYLNALYELVDAEEISEAGLHVAVDPLFGAGQGYLAALLGRLGASVIEIHAESNPGFGGLHPEPIPPWIDSLQRTVLDAGFDAGFVTDGDADRIGACDRHGGFVNPHRILALVIRHLVEDRGMSGTVVKTLSTSVIVDRICAHLGLPVITTPVGFKYIYEKMLEGDVLVGGEESGGIGIPFHVKERDGLAMALLLAEMMAHRNLTLDGLVDELFEVTGPMEYRRVDLGLDPEVKDAFLERAPGLAPAQIAGLPVMGMTREDGIKFLLPDDAWLLLRPSGTEPLVRVYAEASSMGVVDDLLAAGRSLVTEG
jgi:phosphomannomutase